MNKRKAYFVHPSQARWFKQIHSSLSVKLNFISRISISMAKILLTYWGKSFETGNYLIEIVRTLSYNELLEVYSYDRTLQNAMTNCLESPPSTDFIHLNLFYFIYVSSYACPLALCLANFESYVTMIYVFHQPIKKHRAARFIKIEVSISITGSTQSRSKQRVKPYNQAYKRLILLRGDNDKRASASAKWSRPEVWLWHPAAIFAAPVDANGRRTA